MVNSDAIKTWARELGFDLAGVAVAEPLDRCDYLERWLGEGRHGAMDYLARDPAKRCDPRAIVPDARSVICLAMNYDASPPQPSDTNDPVGFVARYAWRTDYHTEIKSRLQLLADRIRQASNHTVHTRRFVDSGPLLEKALACRAGLGWIGKHGLLVSPKFGSWILLAEIVTDLELEADEPMQDRCGDCRRCIDACPTGALLGARDFDPRRCISYMTIEARRATLTDYGAEAAGFLFGCDLCQQACPHNQQKRYRDDPVWPVNPQWRQVPLKWLIGCSQQEFEEYFADSPMLRAGREHLQQIAHTLLDGASRP